RGETRPKNPGAFARQAGSALRGMFHAENAALERMDVFEADRRCKKKQDLDQASHRHARRSCTTQERLHVLRRIIQRPGFAIDGLPLCRAHVGVASADMLCVICIEVRFHWSATLPEYLMVL